MPVERAGEAPLLTLDSGPVSGVTASMFLGAAMGEKNVITTDMGGTSFDVSIIYDGKPAYSFISNTDQYEYFLPKVDLQAIGAGGGSLVRVQPEARTMTVGPDSAGAFPGPVCYGRGGKMPTVTDAQLVLGYLDPDNFAGGRMKLDKEAALREIGLVGKSIGLSTVETAAGICRIVELQMADVIRKVTVEKGFDPRDFVLFAFGGAGPAHAGVFARELGVRKMVIPQRKAASTWCAFGAAAADVLHIFEHSEIMVTPVPAKRINERLDELAEEGLAADEKRRTSPPAASASSSRSTCATRGRSTRSRSCCRGTACPQAYEPLLRKLFVGQVREALRPRLGAGRRAARDRGLPAAGARADAAAEAGRAKSSGKRPFRKAAKRNTALDLLAGPEEIPCHAGVRRREAAHRQPA